MGYPGGRGFFGEKCFGEMASKGIGGYVAGGFQAVGWDVER